MPCSDYWPLYNYVHVNNRQCPVTSVSFSLDCTDRKRLDLSLKSPCLEKKIACHLRLIPRTQKRLENLEMIKNVIIIGVSPLVPRCQREISKRPQRRLQK